MSKLGIQRRLSRLTLVSSTFENYSMLIDLPTLCRRHNILNTGVLHIGAHVAEERDLYVACKFTSVLWIEANPSLVLALKQRLNETPAAFAQEAVREAAVFDIEGEQISFHITNNPQASSLLNLGTHQESYPDIKVTQTINVTSRRVDFLHADEPELFNDLTFVNLDIQGVELQALRGFGKVLDQMNWIYTEVNRDYVYVGNALIWELDRYLLEKGFVRCETHMKSSNWGDAFYVRKNGLDGIELRTRILASHLNEMVWRRLLPLWAAFRRLQRKLRHRSRAKRRT